MTLRQINEWLERYARPFQDEGIGPAQAIAMCRWKLSESVDRESMSRMMPLFANCIETDTEEMP